jgi:hypothetical protein
LGHSGSVAGNHDDGVNNANNTFRSHAGNPTDDDRDLHFVPLAVEVVENMADMEANIRERVLRDAATASVVSCGDTTVIMEKARKREAQRNALIVLALLLVAAVIGMDIGFARKMEETDESTAAPTATLSMPPTDNPTSSPTETPIPTLGAIKERGYIRCCVASEHLLGSFEAELVSVLAALSWPVRFFC